jgi:hypothetical protein
MSTPTRAIFLGLLLIAACARSPVAPDPLPAWLTSLIAQLEAAPPANPPASIARYDYHDEAVYFLPARCCDVPSTLYRADGTILCHPDGGFSGAGDGRCPDFFTARKNETLIWRDVRGS